MMIGTITWDEEFDWGFTSAPSEPTTLIHAAVLLLLLSLVAICLNRLNGWHIKSVASSEPRTDARINRPCHPHRSLTPGFYDFLMAPNRWLLTHDHSHRSRLFNSNLGTGTDRQPKRQSFDSCDHWEHPVSHACLAIHLGFPPQSILRVCRHVDS